MSHKSLSSLTTMTNSSLGRHSLSDSAIDISGRKISHDYFLFDDNIEDFTRELNALIKNFTRKQDRKVQAMFDILTDMKEQKTIQDSENLALRKEYERMKSKVEEMEEDIMINNRKVTNFENRMEQMEVLALATYSEVRKLKRKTVIELLQAKQMGTDDSMSDDVFEDDSLRAPAQRDAPSPTGYRDYQPPTDTPARMHYDDDMPLHKTILLGDSGVGKTSLLVQFETGKFQAGNFSATVGIGFTVYGRHPGSLRGSSQSGIGTEA